MFCTTVNAIENSLAKQDIIAFNVANLNTKGYKEIDSNNYNHKIVKTSKNNQNNVDLTKQIVYLNVNLIDLKANVAVLKSQNKMLGSLIDLKI
ncbi:flagellar basal body protein [Desulfurella sp.]|uniref:flagellar basal body protein n=1 Tax=Desulfurella sp. TaxID=1962857 RepID=UPI0025BFC264|nr:flagellar basal body protein [Desulfurella sp.]